MKRSSRTFPLPDQDRFKDNALAWSRQFNEISWLDSNSSPHLYQSFDAVLAVNALTTIKTNAANALEQLRDYRKAHKDWIFGYLSYDLKNTLEKLTSNNRDGLHFPDLYFFQPKKIFFIKNNEVTCSYIPSIDHEIETDLTDILKYSSAETEKPQPPLTIKARIEKKEYIKRVEEILAHIQRGTIYEANFCQEFYADDVTLNTLSVYKKLNAISQAPFSAYLRLKDHYLLSASPERYLKKEETKIIAQPIKGTAKRSADKEKDIHLKNSLKNNPKERSENIMIVDLVRNDLSKIACKGSVFVEELCKVYAFKQLHQMISTICCTTSKEDPIAIIAATFPMGSMTGAPKISAMQLIEKTEVTKRGLYSGAAGYFSPEGNFDFNVVIRSILYNAEKKYVSFSVGSAITAKSSPEEEYQECLAKAKAMQQVLTEE